jgi:hypothetical protein
MFERTRRILHPVRSLAPAAVALVALGVTLGCGANGGGSSAPHPRTLGTITAAEIRETGVQDAYEALFTLRPEMLPRLAGRSEAVPIYVDGHFNGEGLQLLRQIPFSSIATIRFIKLSTAELQFSTGVSGAIEVTLLSAKH